MTEPEGPPSLFRDRSGTKEVAELFPDEPVIPPGGRRERLDVNEHENVRVRTRTDERKEREAERARNSVTAEGRVELKIDSQFTKFTLFSCNICKSLLLETGIEEHILSWHRRVRHG